MVYIIKETIYNDQSEKDNYKKRFSIGGRGGLTTEQALADMGITHQDILARACLLRSADVELQT